MGSIQRSWWAHLSWRVASAETWFAPPDRGWPYGYEGQEALYVLFRSLVLLGVIGFGLSSSVGTLIAWWGGAVIAPLRLEPVAIYTLCYHRVLCPTGLAAPAGLAAHWIGFVVVADRGASCSD
jgi:divalent metal cation (Fe/Co/Zn/Cd) transporter